MVIFMVKVRVPATTANLGPGFDTLGLALNLYNEFTFEEIPEGYKISGFKKEYGSTNNLVYRSIKETFREIGYTPTGISIDANTNIPISRGLGSSASCILAGVIGGNELAGRPLGKDEIFQLATKIEGHPDNIAPALFGGLVISLMEEEKVIYNRIEVAKGIKFIALISDFTLSTKESREVLPSMVEYKDCINNINKVALLISALTNGRFDLLRYAFKDRLHEPYRGKLIPDFFNIIEKCKKMDSLGVYLSGAGPTIMCIIDEDNEEFTKEIKAYLHTLDQPWNIRELNIDLEGTKIL
ncbi:Homoserine kinase [[Clostridium] ultunense Esp]|uniref:Homoserine kinase n=2 Tax=Schnuerera ultunensis TaxID=45497 RepID=A0A1M4PQI8_9FIRM|nr:Homoserine kinase [[Clostridium] ultunense Esp]